MIVFNVPTIPHDHIRGFYELFDIQQKIIQAMSNGQRNIHLDFSKCRFLPHYAVTVLGGLARYTEHNGCHLQFRWSTVNKRVLTNLLQNGFAGMFGYGTGPWEGNSIPYREDRISNEAAIITYLREDWLGRGWLQISEKLSNAIVGKVWEIYTNTFEHGASPIGTISCGQHYPKLHELHLTVVDFGVGIPTSVRNFHERNSISGAKALQWAFQLGASTKMEDEGGPRGLGLGILKDFIRINKGSLQVFSQDGYARIGNHPDIFEQSKVPFQGSLVDISLTCDESYYVLASEINN
ncbi:hypothetical protein NZD89_09445 [Alicyclobacillus fastidiosus]|uniref:ATP-binding protein n=1 Tax=Alicyclobacillus fastidiosus TaxID=392011 RepID=A0ABY6ZN21_9BACL|nr:ATP-binding protein [Alicyclobacillus fastidiosus]WAH43581.1 hypothetical protein NZD89_09445 [Alicyclobacillus fastidiosus]GMA59762.1 ATP-binding protein [Alicyclobacillus fastidiosus]GMA65539.1 ATP-binding protein [Alicyclobacillus fastidiosus]